MTKFNKLNLAWPSWLHSDPLLVNTRLYRIRVRMHECSSLGTKFFSLTINRIFRILDILSNFQIHLVLQLDLDLDSAKYTCRIANRRLALARSSLTTAPTQLVITMTANALLDLVQPVCAPTGTDHGRATPQSTPLALLVIVFLVETSDCFGSRRSFLVFGQVRLLGTTSMLQNSAGASRAKMAQSGSRRPSLH